MKALYVLAAVLTAFVAQAKAEPSVLLDLPAQLSKETLPAFTAKDRDADKNFQKRHLEKLIEPETERVALVYFATWCKPCTDGAVKLKKEKEMLAKKGILVILVNVGQKEVDLVHSWIDKYSYSGFNLIMDTKSQMVGPYGLLEPDGSVALPKTLVLDKKLKPLFLLGTEGDDFPGILWRFNP